ncbi:MAG: ATPase [Sphingomonadales bacterium]|nr:ATPase [Sphingomonadales bacterium]
MTDPKPMYELSIERHIGASPETVWKVMTERTAEWWCPKPWTTEIVELDWRAGGRAAMIMHGPDGETSPIESIVLEVVPNTRFIFTDALSRGWVPQKAFIVGLFELTPEDEGTHYRASARHWDEESMKRHEEMGFTNGWAAVADQLAELAEASHAKADDPLS